MLLLPIGTKASPCMNRGWSWNPSQPKPKSLMCVARYDFQMVYEDLNTIGLDMAATIHTKRGLLTRVSMAESKSKM